ncbi:MULTISPECIES: hypothetical protein [unclassified Agrobacterium]|uniref:hypothetical protein n=1 Tax=unclassified Agrobacterium TaxID=2632611 RepID=UPI0035C13078
MDLTLLLQLEQGQNLLRRHPTGFLAFGVLLTGHRHREDVAASRPQPSGRSFTLDATGGHAADLLFLPSVSFPSFFFPRSQRVIPVFGRRSQW